MRVWPRRGLEGRSRKIVDYLYRQPAPNIRFGLHYHPLKWSSLTPSPRSRQWWLTSLSTNDDYLVEALFCGDFSCRRSWNRLPFNMQFLTHGFLLDRGFDDGCI